MRSMCVHGCSVVAALVLLGACGDDGGGNGAGTGGTAATAGSGGNGGAGTGGTAGNSGSGGTGGVGGEVTDAAVDDTDASTTEQDAAIADAGQQADASDAMVTQSLEVGAGCGAGDECASGFCVDGVCCSTACEDACYSCAAEDTDDHDGVCAPVAAGDDPDDDCDDDAACGTGQCDGAGACQLRGTEEVCRPALLACDEEETCDGANLICPADEFASPGTSCRPALSSCDAAEVCSGTSPACPVDIYAASTVAADCAPYFCSGNSEACATSCSNHTHCALGNVCSNNTCVPARRIFVSSSLHTGNLGGLAGADAVCAQLASSAGLSGTFRAWLSDQNTSASARIQHFDGPYYRVDGTTVIPVANNWGDLTDGQYYAIATDENGIVRGNSPAWTNTSINGSALTEHCQGWTSAQSTDTGRVGHSSGGNHIWTDWTSRMCNAQSRLYCVQTVING